MRIWIRIQEGKCMRIHAYPDPQPCSKVLYRAGWSCTHVTLNHPFNQDHHERIRYVHHLDGGCQPHQPHHQPRLHRRHWHEGKQTIRTVLPGPAGSGTFFCRIRIFFAGSGPFFPGPIFLPVPDLFCRIGPFLPDLDLFCRIRAFFAGSIPLLPNLVLFCWIRIFLAWSVYFLPDTDPFNRIRTYFTESCLQDPELYADPEIFCQIRRQATHIFLRY